LKNKGTDVFRVFFQIMPYTINQPTKPGQPVSFTDPGAHCIDADGTDISDAYLDIDMGDMEVSTTAQLTPCVYRNNWFVGARDTQ
jgi:hypothetical protein